MSSPAAWHPDPTGRHEHRYWDGERWTEHVANAGVAATDPLDTTGTASDAAAAPDAGSDAGTDTSSFGADGDTSGQTGDAGAGAMPPIEQPGSDAPASSQASHGTPGGAAPSYGAPAASSPPNHGTYSTGGFPAAAPVDPGAPSGSNPMAAIGMALGIASIVLSWLGVLSRFAGLLILIAAIAAIVLGGMGKSRANRGRRGNGMAITAIVTGIIGIIAAGLFLAGGEFWRSFSDEFNDLITCIEETGDEEECQRQFEDQILEREG